MTSNPLPPRARKAGSVGPPAGAEVAILHEQEATPLDAGAVGEVAVRGPGITVGYVDNPEANQAAFVDGWFRTGDQGYIDADGYLTLTGRLKELINRGGEKIAPREVDEALLSHPAVAQAVAFAMPDAAYGEQVAAAVVLKPSTAIGVDELRTHAAERLALFKVPQRIVVVDDVPKGATGKVQRRALAALLGLSNPTCVHGSDSSRAASLEKTVAAVWREVLRQESIRTDEHFIAAGGDSLAAMRIVNRLNATLDCTLTAVDFFGAPTVREQARLIEQRLADQAGTGAVNGRTGGD